MARIAFFGTPTFAVPSLQALLDGDHEVCLVVCQRDRPKGRGKKMLPPPVKECAIAAGVEVAQPATLKKGTDDGDAFVARFSEVAPDLAVVAAYGRILPRRLLALAPKGFVNVHASLLPRWRGAAPIQRAIEAGDDETGVCLMDMVFELDAGDVFARASCGIDDDTDGEQLSERLSQMGAALLAEHLDALLAQRLPKVPQPERGITYAEMLRKEEATLDFSCSARDVSCHARAMYPWPGAQTTLGGETVKLFAPRVVEGEGEAGRVLRAQDALVVACGDGAVAFSDIQVPGKRRMPVRDFVRGRPIEAGVALG